jgi:erythronate-4-phosphate dehydrogenase
MNPIDNIGNDHSAKLTVLADANVVFAKEAFGNIGCVRLVQGRSLSAQDVRDADILVVRSVTRVGRKLLNGSKVRFVGTATIGTDHIDLDYLADRQIGFSSAAGSNANSVAEYVMAAILELGKRFEFTVSGKILGVIGVGNVGRNVVKKSQSLGMIVLQNDPPREHGEKLPDFVSLERILTEADIITVHVPLTTSGNDATFHLFNNARLHRLGKQPIFLNTSRGDVVDNVALLRSIREGRVRGAVLDVWHGEPDIDSELLAAANLGTPHIAGYSYNGKVEGTRMIHAAICKHFRLGVTWDPRPWMLPPSVPLIEERVGKDDADEEVLRRLVRRVYDITADDLRLRGSKGGAHFDRLRAEYPIRREFSDTRVVLSGASPELVNKVAGLGFVIS